MDNNEAGHEEEVAFLSKIIRYCLENKLIVALLVVLIIVWGVAVAPFDWDLGDMPRDPLAVDAIPNIGQNQQIVFTKWPGRSPEDVEDQVTYPLTVSLLGVPGVKTVRSYSMFGFSTIYVIFKEDIEFYWSRSRILEKLNSLPADTLPPGVQPSLGPDATALGQIFWYTLEGRDKNGNPTGGWDLQELRTIQDWYVRYALMSAEGVSEVASVGGFVKEYQIDVDPDAMRAHNVTLQEVVEAVKMSNKDVGARTLEINRVEYVIRGLGFVEKVEDIRNAVIKSADNVPIYVKNVAHVTEGPALRRGALDKGGAETVGGVVVVRHGENPLQTIKNVKKKIKEISPGLPKKTLDDGTVSQVKIVPFYDRTGLIYKTLGTLNTALIDEILVTIIVVLFTVMHLRSSGIISSLLPLSILMCFIAMKMIKLPANIVSLSGIAIAIGVMVDMGIVVCENILKHLDEASPDDDRLEVIYRGSKEVGSAVLTAVSITVVSFLPVFTMEASEGKLFRPLAYTKTFALIAAIIVAICIIPPLAHIVLGTRIKKEWLKKLLYGLTAFTGIVALFFLPWWVGVIILVIGGYQLVKPYIPERYLRFAPLVANGVTILVVGVLLSEHWMPLGPEKGLWRNFIFVITLILGLLFLFRLLQMYYREILAWCLDHKKTFLVIPLLIILLGGMIWLGFNTFFGWLPKTVKESPPVSYIANKFPGVGKEFMPPLEEGSYLFMPTTMPHASIGEALDVLQKQDKAINAIPEVTSAVGKIGRADTPLDPAPVSMIETVINYKSEYMLDKDGHRKRFKYKPDAVDYYRNKKGESVNAPDGEPYKVKGTFVRDKEGNLIPDENGKPFRQWRPELDPELNPGREYWKGIGDREHIWDRIVKVSKIPGTTSAPKLQPIKARLVMLQSGMRAPMGVKVKGPDLKTIEKAGLEIEKYLKEVPSIEPDTVVADRIVGKPYLEIDIDRKKIARYGIMLEKVQNVIEMAIGGKKLSTTVEGRERYPVRVRYKRELRDNIKSLKNVLVSTPDGAQIPIEQLAEIKYRRGPQMIKSEDTFLVGYVVFDMKPGRAEVDVVNEAQNYLMKKRESGEFDMPEGVSYTFAGNYKNQIRAAKKLAVILPLAMFIIFMILYLQFRSTLVTSMVFSGILIAWAGGFILMWLYGEPWFLDFSVFGVHMRNLFQLHTVNLSVAVWVGFLALFGVAAENGVILATYLDQSFARRTPSSVEAIKEASLQAGEKRIRPCLMTTATTILALIPVLTSTGKGADVMVPMAIPSVGGMIFVIVTTFLVPVLYSALKEFKLKHGFEDKHLEQ